MPQSELTAKTDNKQRAWGGFSLKGICKSNETDERIDFLIYTYISAMKKQKLTTFYTDTPEKETKN